MECKKVDKEHKLAVKDSGSTYPGALYILSHHGIGTAGLEADIILST